MYLSTNSDNAPNALIPANPSGREIDLCKMTMYLNASNI